MNASRARATFITAQGLAQDAQEIPKENLARER
jgi:hypothetical protein